MANSHQLVAWTDKGRVRMIPSMITAYVQAELNAINHLSDRIRYRTEYETDDLLRISRMYEKLAVGLLRLGQTEDAFEQFAQAAQCCLASSDWEDTEWGEILCKPLRGRFFAMLGQCKDLIRKHPRLKYIWEESGLQQSCDHVTYAFRCFETSWNDMAGDVNKAKEYTKALRFGKDEG